MPAAIPLYPVPAPPVPTPGAAAQPWVGGPQAPPPAYPAPTYPAPLPPQVLAGLQAQVAALQQQLQQILKGVKPPKPAPAPKPPKPPKPQPAPPPPARRDLHATRAEWFVTQYRTRWNTNEDVPGYDNANCGPTSLTMIARAFGKATFGAGGADAAIEKSRRLMRDTSSERSGTSIAGLARGAQAYGLDAKALGGASARSIAGELAKGRLVIAHVRPSYLFPNSTSGHYTVVTKVEGGKVYLNDPANKNGLTVISESAFNRAIAQRGTYMMVSVGP